MLAENTAGGWGRAEKEKVLGKEQNWSFVGVGVLVVRVSDIKLKDYR